MEPQEDKTQSKPHFWNWVIPKKILTYLIIVFALLFMWFVAVPPAYITKPSGKVFFTECTQQLKNVSSGLEQEISEQGNLSEIHSVDDVCQHILTGHDGPETCRGQVVERINEVCVPGSFKFKKIDDFKYEIKAVSNGKLEQEICVTETAVRPKEYDRKKRQPAMCVHD